MYPMEIGYVRTGVIVVGRGVDGENHVIGFEVLNKYTA